MFGVHLLLGYLTFRSSHFPGWLGILLAIAGLGYLTDSLGAFFGQDLEVSVYTFLGELLLAVWLLIRARHLDVNPSGEGGRAVASAGEVDSRAAVR